MGATGDHLNAPAQRKALLCAQGALKERAAIHLPHLHPAGLAGIQAQDLWFNCVGGSKG